MPAAASTTLSTSRSRNSRPVVAPRAHRTAFARRDDAACAAESPAMFAQTMTSSSAAAALVPTMAGLDWPTSSSRSANAIHVSRAWIAGYCFR